MKLDVLQKRWSRMKGEGEGESMSGGGGLRSLQCTCGQHRVMSDEAPGGRPQLFFLPLRRNSVTCEHQGNRARLALAFSGRRRREQVGADNERSDAASVAAAAAQTCLALAESVYAADTTIEARSEILAAKFCHWMRVNNLAMKQESRGCTDDVQSSPGPDGHVNGKCRWAVEPL